MKNKEKRMFSLKIRVDLLEKLAAYRRDTGATMTWVIERALEEYFERSI